MRVTKDMIIKMIHDKLEHMRKKKATRVYYVKNSYSPSKKIGVAVAYHSTTVFQVEVYKPNIWEIMLDCGGWHTPTTRDRINEIVRVLQIPLVVSIKDGTMKVYFENNRFSCLSIVFRNEISLTYDLERQAFNNLWYKDEINELVNQSFREEMTEEKFKEKFREILDRNVIWSSK